MVRRLYFAALFLSSITTVAFAQQGVHGPRTVTAANTIVNEYTQLTADAAVGAVNLTVANSAMNANGRFAASLQPGDLILIYQVQGVFIENQFSVGPTDTAWGKVTNYFNCGYYEFRQVLAVPNATTITIDCGLTRAYNTINGQKTEIIRVPRYTTLTVNSGGVLTCDDWNGTVGGVLAVEVQGNTVVNAGGSIDATGKGFRGGSLVGDNNTAFGVNTAFSTNNSLGAEKGEGIVGYQAEYDPVWGGRYCRAAGANGGGGGDGHNAGGGGGANAPNSTSAAAVWSGNGIPDPNPAYAAAWNLEPPVNTMTLRTAANSAGGGRGGYTFSDQNMNAGVLAPGQAAWGGDARAYMGTGLGGRPLDYSNGRLFLGGGGGAGDANQSQGGDGGDGGGMIYIMCFGNISGGGTIVSNGNVGLNSQGSPPINSFAGRDGAGGGGAGGTIVLNALGGVAGVSATANGANGGNQVMTWGALYAGPPVEAEGPGGGGGGGYIAISAGAITRTTNGGNNGTTNSGGLTEFPPNGATRGCPGTNNATITNFDIVPGPNQSICAGQSVNLTASVVGTPVPGYVINWYNVSVGGAVLGTGTTYNTGALAAGTYTYWVGTCAGWWREPITVTVNTTPAAPTMSSNSPICSGNTLNLFSNTVAGATYSWTGPNSFSSGLEDPTIAGATTAASGTYSLTITAGVCSSPQGTISVVVNPTPAAPTVGSNSPLCSGQTLNLTANTIAGATYTWTGPNSFSSALEDPSIVGVTTAASGTYSLTVTVGGCTSAMSTVAVTVSNTPAAPTLSSNTPVCSGNALNLFSNTVAGGVYNWTGPNSFSSALEDPSIAGATVAATGTYSLTISVGGCTSPQSTTSVVVNPTPAAPTVGSNSPLCSGQTLNLTSNTYAGGTYSWTGPNSFSSALEDPSIVGVTTAASGTYSLTVTVGGCTSAMSTVAVTVSNTPAAPTLSSNTPVCSGNALNLFSNTVAGGVYNWTGPNSFSSALEDPTIAGATVAATGTYSLTISVGGCTSPQSTTSVVVNPTPAAPTVGSNSPLCSGQTLNLTSNTYAGGTYSWTGPNSFSSSLEDPSIAGVTTAASGTYSLTVTVGGCTSAMSTVAVTVSNTPAAPTLSSNTPVCSGNALNLFSNTVAGGTYTWTGPNSFSSALEDPTIAGATVAATGTYSLTISVGGCTSPQSTTSVVVNPTPAAPTVGSNSPICAGQNLNLTSNTYAGGTYAWTGPNSFSSSLEDPTIAAATTAASGTYSLTVTVGGCTSAQSTVSVIVANTPGAPTLSSNTPVCSGNLLTLFANTVAGGTYNWTGPNSFSSSLEDPTIAGVTTAASGTYSLTITIGACSSPQSTTTVVVNPTPAAPTAGSNSPICSGQTVNLTSNTFAGGTYAWTGPNSFSSALEDPTIPSATTAATGTYSLTVTVGGCTSPQSTVAVVVNQTPAAPTLSSNSPVCSGNNLTLFSNTVPGGTYAWTGPNSYSSTLEDPVISNATTAASGTYSLTITNNGCVSPQSTVSVIVNQTPSAPGAGSNSPVCAGQTLNLTTSTVVGATYSWTGPNSFTSSLEDPSIAGATSAASGMYYVNVTVAGCTSPTDSVSVIVNPIPVPTLNANPAAMCFGDTVQLTGGGGTTYTWNGGSLSAASGANQIDIPGTTTTYTLIVGDINGCTDSITGTVVVNALPVADAGPDQSVCAGTTINLMGTGGGNYTWNGGSLSNASGSMQTDTPPATVDYELLVSDLNGCTDIDSVTVTVNALPIVGAGPDVQICLNSSTLLNGSGASSYVWTPAGSLDDDSIASPTASPIVTTTYVVVGTDVNGCTDDDTVVVTIGNNLTVFASNNITICPGDTAVISVTGGTIWNWSPAGTLATPTNDTTNAFPSTTTTYTVDVQDANGCVGQDSVTVFINSAVGLAATGGTTICIGQSATLTATPSGGTAPYTYTWDNSLTGPGPQTVSPTLTTIYNVFVTDSIGCSSPVQTMTVTVNPPLTLNTIPAASACVGGTANLTASGSGGDGNLVYTWYPGALTGASQTFPVNTTSTYTVVLSDGCGTPTDTQFVVVTANQPPTVSLTSDVNAGCAPLCVNFTGTSSGTCSSEAWDFGDGGNATTSNPGYCYNAAGTYDVIYTCTDANGCVGSDTVTGMITVSGSPTAAFTVTPASPVQLNGGTAQVCATDASTGATTWSWLLTQPTGTQTSSQQNPCFTISDTGAYSVTLVVTNGSGCTDTLTSAFSAEYPCTDLYVPTAFSPNGDGVNDTFFVYGSCIAFMQLEIYSRWGEQVFITTTPANGWDGKWRGKDCESAVFTYVLRGQRDDGTPIEMQGNVTLTK